MPRLTLADPAHRAARETRLAEPHMVPLVAYVTRLRGEFGEVPWPDPADGGWEARLLILLETPGPRIRSTGFVSLENPSGTARNLSGFLDAAGVDRRDLLLWNVIPWIIHAPGAANRAPTAAERARGVALVPSLLDQLPRLRGVALLGRHASLAREAIASRVDNIVAAPHPSPTYVCTDPGIGPRIIDALARADDLSRSPARAD